MVLFNIVAVLLAFGGSIGAAPAELNLATRDVYDAETLDTRATFPTCEPPNSPTLCSLNDIQTCINYLNSKGNTPCVVSPQSAFCVTGTCQILGRTLNGVKSTSSPCSAVASTAQQIVSNCKMGRTQLAGTASVPSNDNMLVNVTKH